MRRISWLAEWLLASREGFCYMELVNRLVKVTQQQLVASFWRQHLLEIWGHLFLSNCHCMTIKELSKQMQLFPDFSVTDSFNFLLPWLLGVNIFFPITATCSRKAEFPFIQYRKSKVGSSFLSYLSIRFFVSIHANRSVWKTHRGKQRSNEHGFHQVQN